MEKRYIAIHGHFYQPSRENPWTGAIDRQPSAAPFHDWNEKITAECYRPNAFSRILDEKNRIRDIVNNYQLISFDFGPALLAWLGKNEAETYQRIIEGDRESCRIQAGHGNAMAHTYNHVILPLANEQDRITQVIWGIKDFRFRFGRDPESFWLPETGVDSPTLELLTKHGIRFVLLSPFQARRVRPLTKAVWSDVTTTGINPRIPYRCFLPGGRYIDIFFYDAPISTGIAFQGFLNDGHALAQNLRQAFSTSPEGPELVSAATDGESYGHHHRFGDMALAHALKIGVPALGLTLINYGRFLEMSSPRFAVAIKEHSSWSCPHGLGRWEADCGCRTGGPPEWNQKWRGPLRQALDLLRDSLAAVFEREGGKYLKDVWAARNDYLDIILDETKEAKDKYFALHARRSLSLEERSLVLALLEIQRHAMLMYSSDAWFFNDLSGLETIQVLRHAAWALEEALQFVGDGLEGAFLKELAKARSNIPTQGDGRKIYRQQALATRRGPEHAVHDYVLGQLIPKRARKGKIYFYQAARLGEERHSGKKCGLSFSRIKLTSEITLESRDFISTLLNLNKGDLADFVLPYLSKKQYQKVKARFRQELKPGITKETIGRLEKDLGAVCLKVKDASYEARDQFFRYLSKGPLKKAREAFLSLAEENRLLLMMILNLGLEVPGELKEVAVQALCLKLEKVVERMGKGAGYLPAVRLAKTLGCQINKPELIKKMSALLAEKTRGLGAILEEDKLSQIEKLLELAQALGIEMEKDRAQDYIFSLISEKKIKPAGAEISRRVTALALKLNFNPKLFSL